MSDSKALTIAGTAVRQMNGLYSLNDLHKASGGEDKHQPAKFVRMEQTQALIAEIENSPKVASLATAGIPAVKTKEGRGGGTYACKELVIAYAAWISAAFHLKVIRVFLAVATPFSKQPGQTLTEEQAATLRNLLTDGVKKLPKEKQGGAMVKGWSKLKAHFKTDYRHIPSDEFHEAVNILARHVAEWEIVDETSSLPRLTLHLTPPAINTYRYNPANPHPINGRTIEVAKSIASDIRNWSDGLPAGPARKDLQDASQTLYDLLVTGWTEVDEALGQMHAAMHYLNRWQGRGGRIGNVS